ncbi:MAG: sigma 54-interacting transcriptional regulator [Gemmatimonadota bacterium]
MSALEARRALPPAPEPERSPVLLLRYDPESASRIAGVLTAAGHPVLVSDSFRELADRLRRTPDPTVVLLAGGLAEPAAGEFLSSLRQGERRVPVIALSESADPRRAEAARRLGVDEVIRKPFDPSEVLLLARGLLARTELERSTRILGRTPAIQEVLEKVALFAPVSSTVLIEGESGTGKELVARAIHARSPRAAQPFVAVNCAALAETLLESELFGHERGSFTGAIAQRQGRFELADRGTLFLDEVGEMPPATQVKLLRAVEEREVVRVGGAEPVHVDVRVIAATNKLLREAVERGEFRRDLYYRLNVLHVRVPPLRERRDDIPLLVGRFALEFARENGRGPVEFAPETMDILQNYDWPGNVRELRNQVERMLVLRPGSRIGPEDVPAHIFERANPRRLLPVAPLHDGSADELGSAERELLYRWLFELKRDVTEIRELLAEASFRGQLLREIPLSGDEEAADGVPPATAGEEAAARLAGGEAEVPGAPRFEVGMSLADLEREAIRLTLAGVKGNRRKAASLLRIGERTLYRKLKEYDLV